jgi:hypothetical protein
MRHTFTALNDAPFSLDLPEPDPHPAAFFLSVHKAGSTLLQRMVRDLCAEAGRAVFELESELFRQGIVPGDCPLDAFLLLERDGYVHSGFRTPWLLHFLRSYRKRAKLLLVRDPRDIAVSYYFSMARSHPLPESGRAREGILRQRQTAAGQDPSAYVLAGNVNGVMNALVNFSRQLGQFDRFDWVRYEDVIFDKAALARRICETMDVTLGEEVLAEVAARHDVRPEEERPDQHIRQVTPGNHEKHLSAEAQAFLFRRFRPAFERFGYEVDPALEAPRKRQAG